MSRFRRAALALATALLSSGLAVPQESSPMSDPAPPALRNRLGEETSPYLLQHAANPVAWQPWTEETIALARALDRPIFLSVGYSTCYWCHVMERESFEDPAIAALLNASFVCVKVDREERPDVDDVYMAAVQAMNRGSGGWPMSVFIEPRRLDPFLAGTYFPPEDRGGRPGFSTVLRNVAGWWRERRPEIDEQAREVGAHVRARIAEAPEPRAIGPETFDRATDALMASFDTEFGGFGQGVNKFPTPVILDWMLEEGRTRADALDALRLTLERMALGGIHDHLGGGFHRYSTDRRWVVPHFEKMLYDQGQLATTYAEAFAATGDPLFAEVARDVVIYVLREMTEPDGTFRSAQDAEVDHREGLNYLWLPEEMRAALVAADLPDEADFALRTWGLDGAANFRDPHHPEELARFVLVRGERPEATAARLGTERAAIVARTRRVADALRQVRDRRPQPMTDDKVLTGWNGLMIAGCADVGRVLGEPIFVAAAERAARRLLGSMRLPDGALARTARGGDVRIEAFLEDYAWLCRGLLALHRATGEESWLREATRLADEAEARFGDPSRGGWYDVVAGRPDLPLRTRTTWDGATPSGGAAMLEASVELAERTGAPRFAERADRAIVAISAMIDAAPTSCIASVRAARRRLGPGGRLDGSAAAPTAIVTMRSDPEAIELAPGATASVRLVLEIAPGHHVNAVDPGDATLVPLTVVLLDGAGLRMTATWPEPETRPGADGGATRVHAGRVEAVIRFERIGAIAGRPRLLVGWQACTETECLAPRRVEAPLAIRGGA